MRLPAFASFLLAAMLCLSLSAIAQKKYSTASQKAIKLFEEGLRAYDTKNSKDAEALFLKALKADDRFIEAHVLLGDVYNDMGRPREAIASYERGAAIDPSFFTNLYFQIGKTQLGIGEYDSAVVNLNRFIDQKRTNPKVKEAAAEMLINAEFGAKAVRQPVPFTPVNLGPSVNTDDYEYFPVLTADEGTLVFTRNRRREGGRDFQEDFYISFPTKEGTWGQAMNLGPPINTDDNEGAQSMTADGHQLFFTGCNRRGGLGSCDIYRSVREGRNWSRPENLGLPINSSKWESQPSVSADGTMLYFSSNRTGGKGSADLYVSRLMPGGQWSEPQNLGDSINTPGFEEAPFFHPDGRTLYFTSDGHPGLGGKDIYMSRMADDGSWGRPVNLGYPINTHKDEMGLFVSASGRTAYYSSDREGGHGHLDIYSFPLYAEARPTPVTYVKGIVRDRDTRKPLGAMFELIDLATGRTVAQSRSDRTTGDFLVCLPVERDYALNVSRDGYLFHSENFSLRGRPLDAPPYAMDVGLQPIEFGKSVVLKNIFFETASYALKPQSAAELDKLLGFLKDNPRIRIEIGGHTDNVGKREDNQLLSENRAKAVQDYLTERGIAASRLSAKGYADTVPIDTNETADGRANNRRTEFTVRE